MISRLHYQRGYFTADSSSESLGQEIAASVLVWRPTVGLVTKDTTFFYHDPESETFQRILAAYAPNKIRYIRGAEFLFYLPDLRRFGILLAMSRVAHDVMACKGKAIRLGLDHLGGGKREWYVPKVLGLQGTFQRGDDPVAVDNFLNCKEEVLSNERIR